MCAQSKKLLALDIDGTAVGTDHRLGKQTKKAFRRIQGAGHVICFASGRHYADMVNMCGDDQHVDYLILNNGGTCVRTADGMLLWQTFMEQAAARELLHYCNSIDAVLYVVAGEYIGVNQLTSGSREYFQSIHLQPRFCREADDLPDRVERFFVSYGHEKVGSHIQKAGLPIEYAPSEPGCADLTPKGIDKWFGIRLLCKHLGIVEENVVAVGNYANDLCMIRGAGVGVAVRNATDEVKEAADYITLSDFSQDAPVEVIERFFD